MKDTPSFPTLVESFFTKRLIAQRRASPHTIASYRDTFRLLLQFAKKRLGKAPSDLILEDLNAPFLGAFLDDLRHPSPTTARAAARDFWLFARRWDIGLAGMAVPAHIWHGTADRNVPVAHARVIAARCPAARLHIVDGGGHLLLSQLDQILASVTSAGQ